MKVKPLFRSAPALSLGAYGGLLVISAGTIISYPAFVLSKLGIEAGPAETGLIYVLALILLSLGCMYMLAGAAEAEWSYWSSLWFRAITFLTCLIAFGVGLAPSWVIVCGSVELFGAVLTGICIGASK